MISPQTRALVIELIDEAVESGARLAPACEILGLSPRTIRRWRTGGKTRLVDQRTLMKRIPSNKLPPEVRDQIVHIANQPEYRSLPPTQIVPALADMDRYLASESSFYRVLRENQQINRRGKSRAPSKRTRPMPICVTGPNMAWSWDITFLPSLVSGLFYRLYMIEDIYSRKIVGWEVHLEENSEHASCLIQKACLAEGVHQAGLILHSDNGSPMKGATMLAKLQSLGIMPSFSRASVSNDNPYSESLFRTLKYCPQYPNLPFSSIDAAREWVARFVRWYNEEHRHSAIRFVTPGQRHRGEDIEILAKRHAVYQRAKQAHPERWSGNTRNWEPIRRVWLNPHKETHQELNLKAA